MLVSERLAHGVTKAKPDDVHLLKQVHGTKIVVVRESEQPPAGVEADGWLTDAADVTLGVYTVPIRIFDDITANTKVWVVRE